MPDTGRYDAERYNPTLAHCHSLGLIFDGAHLSLFASGKLIRSYRAVSGRPTGKTPSGEPTFDYRPAQQRKASQGPIPAGAYWVRPDEIWENAFYKRGSSSSWGRFRLTIHPFETTETFGRGGFFLHGGSNPGSIGCIDLTSEIDRFIQDLRREVGSNTVCQLHLIVDYRT